MVPRPGALERIRHTFQVHPIVSLLGPRQCGKTTLARMLLADEPGEIFDLEDPVDLGRLSAPMTVLDRLEGLVVIDEVQRRPSLFELLRVLADRLGRKARFLLLGSASPTLVRGVSESLAGRVGTVDLAGFDLAEAGADRWPYLFSRGGLPRSYLAEDDAVSFAWRADFLRTFLERDIPQLGIRVPAEALRRFWSMLAHLHGRVWNAADVARSLGASEGTARRYLDVLAGSFVVRVLPPWHENLAKRQVRSPKVYVRDSGLLHALLDLPGLRDVERHPKLGASFEGFALEQVLAALRPPDAHFWATHSGAELDLLVTVGGRRHGFEVKYGDAPGTTKSMRAALADLALEHLWVIYPGPRGYELDERISVVPVTEIGTLKERIGGRGAPAEP